MFYEFRVRIASTINETSGYVRPSLRLVLIILGVNQLHN